MRGFDQLGAALTPFLGVMIGLCLLSAALIYTLWRLWQADAPRHVSTHTRALGCLVEAFCGLCLIGAALGVLSWSIIH